jgi:hypothetical protein
LSLEGFECAKKSLPNNDGLNAPAVRVMRQEKTTPFP